MRAPFPIIYSNFNKNVWDRQETNFNCNNLGKNNKRSTLHARVIDWHVLHRISVSPQVTHDLWSRHANFNPNGYKFSRPIFRCWISPDPTVRKLTKIRPLAAPLQKATGSFSLRCSYSVHAREGEREGNREGAIKRLVRKSVACSCSSWTHSSN